MVGDPHGSNHPRFVTRSISRVAVLVESAREPRGFMTADTGIAFSWLDAFRDDATFSALSSAARSETEFALRVFDRAYAQSPAGLEGRPLEGMKSAQVIDLLSVQIPKMVSAVDAAPFLDALVAFFAWTVKSAGILDRGVEFGCKKVRAEAETSMRDERRWSPAKTMVTLAMRDGVDPSNVELLRAHAVSRGVKSASFDAMFRPRP